ncbi:cation/H(+) antiporter 15 [Citrus clementina]|uniref:cation/H(+) antiporter 15 n=1 Tax=Citrus clementina TaxID=85681 RepID=UPI0003D70D81|nr:cation/H(+) antiporter 15 [Citrus x clementina]
MDTTRILQVAKNALSVGMPCFLLSFNFTISLTLVLRENIPGMVGGSFPFLLSMVLSLNYFPVVHALSELNLLTSDLSQLAISCAILHKTIGWLSVALTSAIIKSDKGINPEGKPVKEIYVLAIGALVMGFLSDAIGTTYLLGALLMGLIIPPGPPLGIAIIERFELVIFHFFLPFFYIRIGQYTNLSSIQNGSRLISFEIIIGASYLGKFVGSLLIWVFIKASIPNAVIFSCILSLKGIMDLIFILRWRIRKLIDKDTFTLAMLTHTAVTAVRTPLISLYYTPYRKLEITQSMEDRMRTLCTTPVNSELRLLEVAAKNFDIHNKDSVHSLITLLKAFNSSEMSPLCACVLHLVELVGRAAPLLVPHNTHKRKIKENSTDRIMRAMTKFSKSSQVTIQPFILIAPYKTMYESISKLAQDEFIPFIILPSHQSHKMQQGGGFNCKIQNCAPCSVGIYVDRGLPINDLIEAEDVSERILDDNVINDFKSRNLGNACVLCHHVDVTNTLEAWEVIRSSDNDYDLVVMGKRRRPNSSRERDMTPWTDYEELRVIGDMLASQDFCGGMNPVLVVQ